MLDSNINNKVINATKWSLFTEVIVKIISPITNMILARILSPDAFGVVATVVMIVSFADIFTDAGFQKYLVQHQFKDSSEKNLSTCVAFWTNLFISLLLWGIIFIFSDQIASAVGNDGLGNVIYIGACILPITSFSSIQSALFRKALNYKSISFARILVKVIPLFVTIPLALLGLSYWALIIGTIVGELGNAILLTALSAWKPQFLFSFKCLMNMFKFCGWTLLETISSWLVTNIGIFVVGTLFDSYTLGIYKTATTMVGQITSLISGATISVLFSALSQLQDDDEAFSKMYNNFLQGIGLIVVPLGVGILLYRDVVRGILLGSQWIEADLLLGLWGFILAESVIFNDMSGAVILAKGRPGLLFISNIIQAILLVPALYISSRYGFVTLIIVNCLVRIQLPATQTILANSVSPINIINILIQIKPYIFATVIMSACSLIMDCLINGSLFFRYIEVIVCIVVYFLALE